MRPDQNDKARAGVDLEAEPLEEIGPDGRPVLRLIPGGAPPVVDLLTLPRADQAAALALLRVRLLELEGDAGDGPPSPARPEEPAAGLPVDVDQPDPGKGIRWYAATDVGNALRLIEARGGDLRWVPRWDVWITWSDDLGVWSEDERESSRLWAQGLEHRIKLEAKDVERAADEADDPKKLEALAKKLRTWSETSQNTTRITAALREARPRVVVSVDDLDTRDNDLVVGNGTIDLSEVTIRTSTREDYATKRSPVKFDYHATCPRWIEFLDWAMCQNADLVSYLQRAVGYSLTGDVSEQAFFFCHGATGRNGKGTFLRAIQGLLGPWAVVMPPGLLFASHGGPPHPTEKARLRGARVAFGNEVQEGARWDEAKLKELTGGDPISARGMNENFFDIRPTWKLWLAAQSKPVATGSDEGLWRRMHLIPWLATVPEGKVDTRLDVALAAELPGILLWALEGVREWRRIGLSPPAAVKDATRDYRAESDIIGQFIADCCTVSQLETVPFAALYGAYTAWSKANGFTHTFHAPRFSMEIVKRGFERFIPSRGAGGERPRSVRGLTISASYAESLDGDASRRQTRAF